MKNRVNTSGLLCGLFPTKSNDASTRKCSLTVCNPYRIQNFVRIFKINLNTRTELI